MADDLRITRGVTIPAAELHWSAARASGPGGQNVNKVATKVVLRFDVAASGALSAAAKTRLGRLAGDRLDATGRLTITAQSTRSQARNLDIAREKLATLVRRALVRPKSRRATTATATSKRRRLAAKRQHGDRKRERMQPRPNDDT